MARFDVRDERGLVKGMLGLALPVLVEESLMLAVGYTDWWLAGHFVPGPAALAAMGLMAYLLWLLPSLFAALAIGATAIISRRIGEGRLDEANRTAHQAFLAGALLSLVATGLALAWSDAIPRWMQLSGEAADYATRYFRTVAAVLPLIMIEQVVIASLRGAGDTLTGLGIKGLVVVVNLIVSTGLVSGWGPFPQLGWDGLAIGTATAHGLGGLLAAAVVLRGRSGLVFRSPLLRPDAGILRLLMRIGLPGGIDIGAIILFQFLFVAIVNRLGDASAAAHGLAVQIEALAYMPGSAFQVAAATMAGQYLGAGNPRAARRATVACLLAGGAVMGSAALVFAFGGPWLTSLFVGAEGAATAEQAARLLRIVALGIPPLTVCMIGSGTLRGSGDTVWPLTITLLGFAAIRLPLAILWTDATGAAGGWGWNGGVEGAWWAMLADLLIRSLLIGGRLTHGGWSRVRLDR